MDVFDLEAFIRLNVDDYMNELGNAEEATKNTGSKLKNGFKAVGAAAGASLVAAGAGVAKIGKEAFDAYADYEQLVGGVETLFKESAGTVQAYADMAFQTAGLSSNEYMETVTSFSASLLQSVGNDTDKAADIANQAIIDMSDNANKMGSDMSSIQNAYSGFAKQNYTMLDNLKLGYGGTKEEMERLLADAEKFSGIKYDISSYADIIEAIHVVQGELGISGRTAEEAAAIIERTGRSTDEVYEQLGTTAKEASTTIQGSLASLKSSWNNILVGIADDTQPFDKLVDNFVDAVVTVGDNIMPRVEKILDGVGKLVEGLAPKIAQILPNMLQEVLPSLISAVTSLVKSLAKSLPQIIKVLVKAIIENLPVIIEGLVSLIVELVNALPEIIVPIIDALPTIITNIVDGLLQAIPQLVTGCIRLVVELVKYLPEIIYGLITAIPEIISSILEAFGPLGDGLGSLFGGIFDVAEGILGEVGSLFSDLFDGIALLLTDPKEALNNFFDWMWEKANLVVNSVKDIFVGLFELIPAWLDEFDAAERADKAKSRNAELVNTNPDIIGMDENGNFIMSEDFIASATRAKTTSAVSTTVNHTGTITFEGVNNEGELIGASSVVIDDITTSMQREARLGYGN